MKINFQSAETVAGFLARLDIYTPEQIERRIVLDHGVRPSEAKQIVASALAAAEEGSARDEAIIEADRGAVQAEFNC